LEEEEKDQGQE
jgi:hypothetical protein